MGKSLSRNFADKGINLALYNRFISGSEEKVAEKFITSFPELKSASGFENLQEFVNDLQQPRKIFLMIPAGAAIDQTIKDLIPLLSIGDLIIDGGNSHYKLTEERHKKLTDHDIFYIGTGVSGGEEGALKGPSIMPGGDKEAYGKIKPELEAIAAKDKNGQPCCGHIGKGGAGHFVKMVHNGIEYAEMQLIAELYGSLRWSWGYPIEKIADLFESWLDSEVNSYLLEITIDILRKKEGDDHVIDLILDKAGNKGTGSWTTIAACELGIPTPTLTAALFARYQSAFKTDRVKTEKVYTPSVESTKADLEHFLTAYQTARVINHHQGLQLILAASKNYDWDINLPEVTRIWTNGCIIRSALMDKLNELLKEQPNLLLHPEIIKEVSTGIISLRTLVAQNSASGTANPCLSSALGYIETQIRSQSTANIIQAQRDYFGAHTYERTDEPRGNFFHMDWLHPERPESKV